MMAITYGLLIPAAVAVGCGKETEEAQPVEEMRYARRAEWNGQCLIAAKKDDVIRDVFRC